MTSEYCEKVFYFRESANLTVFILVLFLLLYKTLTTGQFGFILILQLSSITDGSQGRNSKKGRPEAENMGECCLLAQLPNTVQLAFLYHPSPSSKGVVLLPVSYTRPQKFLIRKILENCLQASLIETFPQFRFTLTQ